jgi:hypothetical protein
MLTPTVLRVGLNGRAEGGEIIRFRILDVVTCQGFDAYTNTLGQVCCKGVEKVSVMVGTESDPDTVKLMSRLIESMVMVMVDQELSGWATPGTRYRWFSERLPEEMR